jgi:carbon storage regulator
MWRLSIKDSIMLYLTRKIGEGIVINQHITLDVLEITGKTVKLGFSGGEKASILRRELFEKIQAENRAARSSADLFNVLTLGNFYAETD